MSTRRKVKAEQVIELSLADLQFPKGDEGDLLNPRGLIHDTTDLQESMRLIGQLTPIQVVAENNHYLVVDGHRRTIAARALGWECIRAEIVPGEDMLARMLGAAVRRDFKPTQWGSAIQSLSRRQWGIERVSALCGLKVDRAQLYVDLLSAPESVQRRVDTGEMSLTAFKALRDKPKEVQEKIAALETPITVRAVKQAIKKESTKGILTDLLDQMAVEHVLAKDLNALKMRAIAEWQRMSGSEQMRVAAIVESLYEFVRINLEDNYAVENG